MDKLSFSEASKYFAQGLYRILTLGLFSLLVMTGFRLFAHLYYQGAEEFLHDFNQAPLEVWRAYWMGLRFDLSTFSYLSVIPVLTNLLASLRRRRLAWWRAQKFNSFYFSLMLLLLVVCLAGDTGYYSYFQDHINVMLFGFFEDDTAALLRTFWKNYPLFQWAMILILLGTVLRLAVRRVLLRPLLIEAKTESPAWMFLRWVLPVVLIFVLARGSLGLFPLSVQDTVVSQRSFLNHLSYNGFHALMRAIKLKRAQNAQWNANLVFFGYQDPREAFADYYDLPLSEVPADPLSLLHQRTPSNPWAEKVRPHVLVLVMESFGSAYLQYDNPEFQVLGELKKHFSEDFLSLQFLPGHSSTIGSLSSLMIAAPQRPAAGFLTETQYLQVPFRSSAARVFQRQGYRSKFVYGGNPGWRDINKFALTQGFDTVEGEVDIEKSLGPLQEKHEWGVFDEDVFRYLEKSFLEAQGPQMILAMTTTNHPPYQVPASYQPAPLKAPSSLENRLVTDRNLVQNRFRAYQYSNQKLGEFLSRIKSSPLRDKLIIAVTGDHSFWMVNFSEQEQLKKWGVPFYLYLPPAIKPKAFPSPVFGSHFDIFTTLYPLALSGAEHDSVGKNLLSSGAPTLSLFSGGLAFNAAGGILAQKGREAYAPFGWAPPFEKLEATMPNSELDGLARKYKALMSLMDYYFMRESEAFRAQKREQAK